MDTSVHITYYIVLLVLPDSTSTLYNHVDDLFEDSIYLNPCDIGGYLEHINWPFMELKSHQLGVIFNTHTWDLGLQWSLHYFNMVTSTCTWNPSSLSYFSITVHTYPWDPGIWLYFLIKSIEDYTFIRGVECSVSRGIIWGT